MALKAAGQRLGEDLTRIKGEARLCLLVRFLVCCQGLAEHIHAGRKVSQETARQPLTVNGLAKDSSTQHILILTAGIFLQ